MELNYKDWKDMLVSKTAVSSEDASVTDQHELQSCLADQYVFPILVTGVILIL